MRKYSILVFIAICCLGIAFGANLTEELFVKENGWCVNIPLDFQVYNKTDYDNLEYLTEHDPNSIHNITATYTIHSGPFESMPILTSGTSNAHGVFTYTFTETGMYYYTVEETNKLYKLYTSKIEILPCKVKAPLTYDRIINYSLQQTTLKVFQTSAQDTAFNVTPVNPTLVPTLEGAERIIKIDTAAKYLSMTLELNANPDQKLYSLVQGQWQEQPAIFADTKLSLTNAQIGTYALVTPVIHLVVPTVTQNTTVVENNTPTQQIVEDTPVPTVPQQKGFSTSFIFISILIPITIILAIFGTRRKKKKEEVTTYGVTNEPQTKTTATNIGETTINQTLTQPQVLTEQNQIYLQTKQYIQAYKQQYTQDQIYRALKDANVSEEIISKVFKEEY